MERVTSTSWVPDGPTVTKKKCAWLASSHDRRALSFTGVVLQKRPEPRPGLGGEVVIARVRKNGGLEGHAGGGFGGCDGGLKRGGDCVFLGRGVMVQGESLLYA